MRTKHPTSFLRTAPSIIGPEFELGSKDKLVVTNTVGAIVQTLMAKDLSANECDFMIYAGLGKGIWGYICEEVDQFVQGLRS